jgi:protein-tyrosine phosphatase
VKQNKKILFVCLGNICRSPAAQAVFESLISENEYTVDSAGTSAIHAGEKADARMRQAAKARGLELTSISRGLTPKDLLEFDYIIAMDNSNFDNIRCLDAQGEHSSKIHKMTAFLSSKYADVKEIPDPYYGGNEGFSFVLDLLEDACQGLLEHLKQT